MCVCLCVCACVCSPEGSDAVGVSEGHESYTVYEHHYSIPEVQYSMVR
jgi:hypothetical protein